ncbi:MAG: ABC transporter ATP-binding protein [Deltaproteobacteria bacterium]|nr:ABC transporter ATP-binding protein [Deltaproteobacteria bacterium]PWB62147.1 MAG: ABC transporter ATP-binding protein [Deltaproteobacteria bacterium]
MAVNYASLSVNKGELRALIGPNGAGKTTLLNLITGIHTASSGTIRFKGEDITRLPPDRISRRGISRTLQVTSLFSGLTVYENVWAAVQSRKRFFNPFVRAEAWKDVAGKTEAMLELTGLSDKARTVCSELSYGDQRILEMGIALSTEPDLLLLDEPTAGLSTRESMGLVKRMRAMLGGRTILLVEHDMGVVMELSDRITVLHYGEVLAEGTPAEIMANAEVHKVYLGS